MALGGSNKNDLVHYPYGISCCQLSIVTASTLGNCFACYSCRLLWFSPSPISCRFFSGRSSTRGVVTETAAVRSTSIATQRDRNIEISTRISQEGETPTNQRVWLLLTTLKSGSKNGCMDSGPCVAVRLLIGASRSLSVLPSPVFILKKFPAFRVFCLSLLHDMQADVRVAEQCTWRFASLFIGSE